MSFCYKCPVHVLIPLVSLSVHNLCISDLNWRLLRSRPLILSSLALDLVELSGDNVVITYAHMHAQWQEAWSGFVICHQFMQRQCLGSLPRTRCSDSKKKGSKSSSIKSSVIFP